MDPTLYEVSFNFLDFWTEFVSYGVMMLFSVMMSTAKLLFTFRRKKLQVVLNELNLKTDDGMKRISFEVEGFSNHTNLLFDFVEQIMHCFSVPILLQLCTIATLLFNGSFNEFLYYYSLFAKHGEEFMAVYHKCDKLIESLPEDGPYLNMVINAKEILGSFAETIMQKLSTFCVTAFFLFFEFSLFFILTFVICHALKSEVSPVD